MQRRDMEPAIDLKEKETILFIGDSITDADRLELSYEPFGFGYVHFAANALLAKYPQLELNIINRGVSGNTIRDMKGRWQKDCIDNEPDILSVLIGVNDVFRQFQDGRFEEGVSLQEYELTYKQLLLQAKKECGSQLILMEPFMFCGNQEDGVFKKLQDYIEVVRVLADEFGAVLVPLQRLIDEKIKHVPAQKWSLDSVHPYVWAHCWISQCWLEFTAF